MERAFQPEACDFSGWATRNDLKCSDGRVIRRDAFKHDDGIKVRSYGIISTMIHAMCLVMHGWKIVRKVFIPTAFSTEFRIRRDWKDSC